MEDAILGNSKGATYKSFILDVEIVVKSEGVANIAERKVENKNTSKKKEETENIKQRNEVQKNNQDVHLLITEQVDLSKINNQSNSEKLNNCDSTYCKTSSSIEPIVKNKQSCETLLSEERNTLKTRKRHKNNDIKYNLDYCSKIEPFHLLESDIVSNYHCVPRKNNSDSAIYCTYFKTRNKALNEENKDNLTNPLRNAKSAGEIFFTLETGSTFWIDTIKTKVPSSTSDLQIMLSSGDNDVTKTFKICAEYIENQNKLIKTNKRTSSAVNNEIDMANEPYKTKNCRIANLFKRLKRLKRVTLNLIQMQRIPSD